MFVTPERSLALLKQTKAALDVVAHDASPEHDALAGKYFLLVIFLLLDVVAHDASPEHDALAGKYFLLVNISS